MAEYFRVENKLEKHFYFALNHISIKRSDQELAFSRRTPFIFPCRHFVGNGAKVCCSAGRTAQVYGLCLCEVNEKGDTEIRPRVKNNGQCDRAAAAIAENKANEFEAENEHKIRSSSVLCRNEIITVG